MGVNRRDGPAFALLDAPDFSRAFCARSGPFPAPPGLAHPLPGKC
jgi:hypothetical protein